MNSENQTVNDNFDFGKLQEALVSVLPKRLRDDLLAMKSEDNSSLKRRVENIQASLSILKDMLRDLDSEILELECTLKSRGVL